MMSENPSSSPLPGIKKLQNMMLFGNNPPPRLTQGPEMPMLFGNNPPPRLTQGLPERPMSQPTPAVPFVPLRQLAVSGDSNNAQSSSLGRFQSQGPESLMRMGRAPNIRPVTNVGKATGGPVGLASLIGQY
tara:strand:+ start:1042 stop:1434 length:393 start_codon:yes stop_codon:yes gene_type:complete